MSKPFDELKSKHLNLLRLSESEIAIDEVRQFIEECRKAGRDISDPDERDYVRTNILRYWRNLIYSKTDTYPDIELEPPREEITVGRAEEKRRQEKLLALYAEAVGFLRAKEWQKALDKWAEVQAIDPRYPDPQKVAATARREIDRLAEEKRRQEKLAALYAEAVGFLKAKEWQKALGKWAEVQAIEPEYPDGKKVVTKAKRELAKLEEAALPVGLVRVEEEEVPIWRRVPVWAWGAVGGVILLVIVGGVLAIAGGGEKVKPTPTPVAVRTATPTATSTSTPTFIVVILPTPTLTGTLMPTDTPSPTNTPTSTPYPTPALVGPDEGTSFPKGQDVKLAWEERDLAENEFFEVRIRLRGEQEFDQIYLTKMPYEFVLASELTQAGTYEWQVTIVSLSGEEKGVSQIWSFEVQ